MIIVIGEILYSVHFIVLWEHYKVTNEELTMHQSQFLYNSDLNIYNNQVFRLNVMKISSTLDKTTFNAFVRQMANAT